MRDSMASKTRVTSNDDNKENELDNVDNYFSDESSFYGDEDIKHELGQRVAAYDPKDYWDVVHWNIQCLKAQEGPSAAQGVKRKRDDSTTSTAGEEQSRREGDDNSSKSAEVETLTSPPAPVKAFNPYEGDRMAKQLDETLDQFLERLRPSVTRISAGGPWIWIADPHSKLRPLDQDIAGFKQLGSNAIDGFLAQKSVYEQQKPTKAAAAITRMLKPDREFLEARIVQLAREKGVTCGKWMLFPSPEQVDSVWATVARAVLQGELGCSAKVATEDGDPNSKERLVCVYTGDFSDVQDVKRVLGRMQELGLLKDRTDKSRPIYYKCDAYTHLDITSGNEYKIKASMYNSKDLLAEMQVGSV